MNRVLSDPFRPIHPLILSKMVRLLPMSGLNIRNNLFALFADIMNFQGFSIKGPTPVSNHELLIDMSRMGSLFIVLSSLHHRLDGMAPIHLCELLSILTRLLSRSDIFEWPNLYDSLIHVIIHCIGVLKVFNFIDQHRDPTDKMFLSPQLPDNVRHYLTGFSTFGTQSFLHD